jgi:restriction system protein
MPIPDFQSLMLPVLKSMRDGKEHTLREIIDITAEQFNLTPKKELIFYRVAIS